MKLDLRKEKVEDEGAIETRTASIKMSPVISHVLSRDLYTRPIESCIREILFNALDAHVEAEKAVPHWQKRPVEITCPDTFEELFRIRDFGIGMSHEDVMDIYLSYGESTRRGDNERHGGFGLGTKSPLAYTDFFEVESFQEGKKRTYLIYYNDEGEPCLSYRSETETEEPDGLCVQFTTKVGTDYPHFQKALKAILKHVPKELVKVTPDLDVSKIHYIMEFGNLKFSQGTGFEAIMGYVRYDIDDDLPDMIEDMSIKFAMRTPLLLTSSNDIPQDSDLMTQVNVSMRDALKKMSTAFKVTIVSEIGALQLHPSRERLVLTKRTMKGITNIIFSELGKNLKTLDKPELSRDLLYYSALGMPLPFSDLKLRARVIKRTYDYSSSASFSEALTDYNKLMEYLSQRTKNIGSIQYAFMDKTQLTTLVAGGRSRSIFPDSIDRHINSLVVLDYESTDPIVLKAVQMGCSNANLGDYLLEAEKAIKLAESSRANRQNYHRAVARSMSHPSHNILILNFNKCKPPENVGQYSEIYKSYKHGNHKRCWDSDKMSVKDLQAITQPLFWVPTKNGCCGIQKNDDTWTLDEAVNAVKTLSILMKPKDVPMIIGLPGSRGTKTIEAMFSSFEDKFYDWMVNYLDRSSILRHIWLQIFYNEYGRHLEPPAMGTFSHYGPVHKLNKLYKRSNLTNTKYGINLDYLKPYMEIKTPSWMEELERHVSTRFPVTWSAFNGTREDLHINMHFWARKLATLTNLHPQGAKKP